MPKIIGIIGSRRRRSFADFHAVRTAFLQVYEEGDSIVSGGCPVGGDRFAEQIAEEFDLVRMFPQNGAVLAAHRVMIIHRAEWNIFGKSAGFKRNAYIARDADVLIACVADDRTGGTEDTIRKFKGMGKGEVVIV